MAAVLKITDGTTSVNLLGGPFYLSNWRPSIAQYKGDGVFLDSPLSTGRVLAYRAYANATERFDLKMRASDDDTAAYHMGQLFFLMNKAAEHHISLGETSPVWVERKAHRETGTTYAIVVKASMPDQENPFSQPFLQTDCAAVMDNLVLLVERFHWQSSIPGTLRTIDVTEVVPESDVVPDPSFERSIGNVYTNNWTDYNSPTTSEVSLDRAYDGRASLYLEGTSGSYKGTYMDISSLAGETKTITAKCYVTSGAGALIVYDGGGFTNAVADISLSRDQELLTNGDFETNVNGWTAATGAIARVAGGYGGSSWGMQVSPSAGVSSVECDWEANTSDNIAFKISFAVKRTSAGIGNMYVGTHWKNEGNWEIPSEITILGVRPPVRPYARVETPVQDQWYFYEFIVEAPTREEWWNTNSGTRSPSHSWTYFENIQLHLYDYANTATMVFDKVSIKAVAPLINEEGEWQTLSVTKTVPVGGSMRLALATDTTLGGEVYFDDIQYKRSYMPADTQYEKAFVGAAGLEYNLSHLYVEDNTVFSDNLLEGDPPYELLPTTPVQAQDKIYFGSIDGPFPNLAFELSSVLAADAVGIVWKYYNGSTWGTLDVRDPTNELTTGGRQVVSWYVPDDWTKTTINSINAYWILADVTLMTSPIAIPVQQTSHVHVVNKPFFEIDEASLGGDVPSAIRYRIFNESGPTAGNLFLSVATGNDDCTTDDDAQSIAKAGSTWRLEADTSVGVRFQNVVIPQGATVTSARLWFTIDSSSAVSTDPTVFTLYSMRGEDADNSTIFTAETWAGFDGRARTSAYVYAINATGTYIDPTMAGSIGAWNPSIAPIVQEIVNRSGWTSGNALTIFLTDENIPAGEYLQGDMYEGDAGAWRLEVNWLPNARYTNAIYMGSRKVSRGQDFRGYINFSYNQPAGIKVSPGPSTSYVTMPGRGGAVVPYANTLMYRYDPAFPWFPGNDPSGQFFGKDGFVSSATIQITRPLAASYKGKYRAFLRAIREWDQTTGNYANVEVRLQSKVGTGGSVYSNAATIASSDEPMLLDLGPVTVPGVLPGEVIQLIIQVKAQSDWTIGAGGWPLSAINLFLMDLILMPIDEWFVEAELSANLGVALDADSYLEIDSATLETYGMTASIRDKKSGDVRANLITSGLPAIIDPSETHRVWLLPMTNRTRGDMPGGTPGEETGRASYSDMAHSVSVDALEKFLGMRGAS